MTQRLIAIGEDNWDDIDGFAVAHMSTSLESLPVGRFARFVWWWATQNSEGKEKEKFKARLWRPPKGEEGKGPWAPSEENRAFSDVKQSLGI